MLFLSWGGEAWGSVPAGSVGNPKHYDPTDTCQPTTVVLLCNIVRAKTSLNLQQFISQQANQKRKKTWGETRKKVGGLENQTILKKLTLSITPP